MRRALYGVAAAIAADSDGVSFTVSAMSDVSDDEFLGKAMGECLDACIDKGFEFPMHLVLLARNGALVAVRYTEDDDADVQAEAIAGHSDDGKFLRPIHVMVVDAKGRALRLRVGADGTPEPMLN
jgi:hypothetical protein